MSNVIRPLISNNLLPDERFNWKSLRLVILVESRKCLKSSMYCVWWYSIEDCVNIYRNCYHLGGRKYCSSMDSYNCTSRRLKRVSASLFDVDIVFLVSNCRYCCYPSTFSVLKAFKRHLPTTVRQAAVFAALNLEVPRLPSIAAEAFGYLLGWIISWVYISIQCYVSYWTFQCTVDRFK